MHHQRGNTVCNNNLLIGRRDLEKRLLRQLQDAVLQDEVVEYAIERLRADLELEHAALNKQLKGFRDQKRQLESEIVDLVEVIAAGNNSPSVMAASADRENKIREITDQLIEPGPGSFQ